MQTNRENNCCISLKDCKEDFHNNPTLRLINPAENELGKIGKVNLDKINKNIREMEKYKYCHRLIYYYPR